MARVISASLFIYRKINNGSSVRHEYVGKYDINAKGNTFSVELVEESSKLDTSFIESRMTEEGVDPKLYEVCKGIKQMLSKHIQTCAHDTWSKKHSRCTLEHILHKSLRIQITLDSRKKCSRTGLAEGWIAKMSLWLQPGPVL